MIKKIRLWFAPIFTILLIFALFGIVFIKLGIAQPSAEFFTELGLVLILVILNKVWWYDNTELKRLEEDPTLLKAKDDYYSLYDSTVLDPNDVEEFLKELNRENRAAYLKNKIGTLTPKDLAQKTFLMCVFHPSYTKKSAEEIGLIRFKKICIKYKKKADKIKKIQLSDLRSLSDTELLYDSKNHMKRKKIAYQTSTTVISALLTIAIAMTAFEEIATNWENVFRFITYLAAMLWAVLSSIVAAYKITGEETLDYLGRLSGILEKYKARRDTTYGKYSNNVCIGLCEYDEDVQTKTSQTE